ncbi:DUF1802 family protein [Methanobacterium alcaliphilum]|uniref:DUF1802 family protein n=1 Tax=Methanobacterium alcaliphilum TaxID=392018 RepID=UPI00200A2261|nr:DUF1802 family protein [Methanobacterium alcaliphilum]MCK9151541.1 DUF1802 family protein [Methanobacterium alcaliphilum]
MKITKCLNEWNATLEALGQGQQSILIRNYKTIVEDFLLFPTVSYLNNENFLESFQDKYKLFVQENAHPQKNDSKTLVKYYAKVEDVLEKPANRIGGLNKYHIWTNEHVRSYLNSSKAYVWLLRVYELKEPVWTERTRGMVFANTTEEISLEGIIPVLSDDEFNQIQSEITK